MEEDIGGYVPGQTLVQLHDQLEVVRRDVRAAGRWSRRVGDLLWLQHIVSELRDAAVAADAGQRAPLMSDKKFQMTLSKDCTLRTEKKLTILFRIGNAAQRVLGQWQAEALAAGNTSALEWGLAFYTSILSQLLETDGLRPRILPGKQPKGSWPVRAAPGFKWKRGKLVRTRRQGIRRGKRRPRFRRSLKGYYEWVLNRGIRVGARKYWNYSFCDSQDFNKLKLVKKNMAMSMKATGLDSFKCRHPYRPLVLWLDPAMKAHCKDYVPLNKPGMEKACQSLSTYTSVKTHGRKTACAVQAIETTCAGYKMKAASSLAGPAVWACLSPAIVAPTRPHVRRALPPGVSLSNAIVMTKALREDVMKAYFCMVRGSDWDPHIRWLLRFAWLLREEAVAVGPTNPAEHHMSYQQFSEPFALQYSLKELKRQKSLLISIADKARASLKKVHGAARAAKDMEAVKRGHAFWLRLGDELDPNRELSMAWRAKL